MSKLDVPDYFLERYAEEFSAWARNLAKIGPVKAFVLKEGPFADPSPNEEQGAELIQVRLLCKLSRTHGVEIEPLTERDRRNIARHCEKMQRLNIPSRRFFAEPERPWLPFMPDIAKG